MVAGSILALRQKDLKRMIAYSSIAHIGYIFMGIGFNTPIGFAAATYHVVAHAFTKSMIFIAAGSLINLAGTKMIPDMRGVARRDKVAGFAFIVGAMSLIGIPLFAGFPSKFYLANAVLTREGQGMWIAVITIGLSTFLNALYYIPALFKLYSSGDKPETGSAAVEMSGMKPEFSASLAMICLIVANFALGIFYIPLMNALERGFALFG